jgi:hypothetical protein
MLGLAMNWRNIISCNFEFLKLSHNIRIFGIFSVATMTITTCCVCGVYYHCVKKWREREGGDISGR